MEKSWRRRLGDAASRDQPISDSAEQEKGKEQIRGQTDSEPARGIFLVTGSEVNM